MRYAEQVKSSLNYHWGIFREVWDIFTLQNWHWLIIGLLVVLCVIPVTIYPLTPVIGYYVTTPAPAFAPSLSQELAFTEYYSKATPVPSIPAVVSFYWVRSDGFEPLVVVLCLVSMGLLLVAYFREK